MMKIQTFRKSLWIQLLLVSVVSLLVCNTFTYTQEPHWMPDANLRAVVEEVLREEIGLPKNVPLQKEHMALLVSIVEDNGGIRSLQGLEFAINLEELDVYRNQIEDIRPLSNLPKLNRLVIWHNQVSDISPLASIETLTDLNISDNPISDLRPLSKLIGLRVIKAWTCQIRDVNPLSELINLKELHLRGNSITDVSPLANLTQLEILDMRDNPIGDFTALQHLNITEYTHDTICDQTVEFPAPSIEERVTTRTYPSIFQAWNPVLVEGVMTDVYYQDEALDKYTTYHDLLFSARLEHHIKADTPPYYGLVRQVLGNIEIAKEVHQRRLRRNPNFVFLTVVQLHDVLPAFPDNPNFWLRSDIDGGLIGYDNGFWLNLLNPEVQDMLIERIVSIASCGLFDGMMIDSFTSFTNDRYGRIDRSRVSEAMRAEIMDALVYIFSEVRTRVPDDFLILVNGEIGTGELESFTEYINGSFMEIVREPHRHYNYDDLVLIEDLLLWNEENLRYPQINCVEGFGLPDEPPDGPNDQRWMRVFMTLSLTHSDGYMLYNRGGFYIGEAHHEHIWYPFWDAP